MAQASSPLVEMALVEMTDVAKHFGKVIALNGVSLTVNAGEVLCLLGDNGAGKSTLIKVLSGVHKPTKGQIRMSGEDVDFDSPRDAQKMGIATVYQDLAMIPLTSITRNFFMGREPTHKIGPFMDFKFANKVTREEMIKIGIDIRDPEQAVGTLSGGERQRVAIARTLLTQPRLLLLDEPLAALDVGHKQEILPYLEALPNRFGLPAIFVSHAVNEMARLADNVIVLENGSVTASGSAAGILSREELQMSAMPFEAVSIFDVRVVENLPGEQLTRVTYDDQRITIPGIIDAGEGDSIRLVVRAGDVVLATAEPKHLSVRNVLHGKIEAVDAIPDSPFSIVSVDIGGAGLKAQLTQHAIGELGLTPGMMVYALIKTATFDRAI